MKLQIRRILVWILSLIPSVFLLTFIVLSAQAEQDLLRMSVTTAGRLVQPVPGELVTVNAPLVAQPSAPDMQITEVTSEPSTIRPGEVVTVSVDYQNRGNSTATGFQLRLETSSPQLVYEQNSSTSVTLPLEELSAGATNAESGAFRALPDSVDGDYTIMANLLGPDGQLTASQPTTVTIQRPSEPDFQVQQLVELAEIPGQAKLLIDFRNDGVAVPDARLVLQYDPDLLAIEAARLDSESQPGLQQENQGRYDWQIPNVDWQDPVWHSLEITLHVAAEFTAPSEVSISFVGPQGMIGDRIPLSSENLRILARAAQLAQNLATEEAGTAQAVVAAEEMIATETAQAVAVTEEVIAAQGTETAQAQETAAAQAAIATQTVASETTPMATTATPGPTSTPIIDIRSLETWQIALIFGVPLFLIGISIALFFITPRIRKEGAQPAGAGPIGSHSPGVYLELVEDGRRFPISTIPFTIGRTGNNSLIIDESFPQWQTISRDHAVITQHPQGYVIEDRGSQNGIRVQGRPTPKNLLHSGWAVTVGGVEFRFYSDTNPRGVS